MKRCITFALAAAFAATLAAQEPVQKPKTPSETRPEAAKDRRMGLAKPLVLEKDREVYGAPLTIKEPTKLADILKDPKAYEGKKVRVAGAIQEVCQKKGCFMYVSDGAARTQVKFTDYAFFVPLDVSGRSVTVEGTPQVTVHTEARRRHYAEDQGLPKEEIEKIKGDQTVVVLMVDAVEIGGKCEMPKSEKAAETKPAKKEG